MEFIGLMAAFCRIGICVDAMDVDFPGRFQNLPLRKTNFLNIFYHVNSNRRYFHVFFVINYFFYHI